MTSSTNESGTDTLVFIVIGYWLHPRCGPFLQAVDNVPQALLIYKPYFPSLRATCGERLPGQVSSIGCSSEESQKYECFLDLVVASQDLALSFLAHT